VFVKIKSWSWKCKTNYSRSGGVFIWWRASSKWPKGFYSIRVFYYGQRVWGDTVQFISVTGISKLALIFSSKCLPDAKFSVTLLI